MTTREEILALVAKAQAAGIDARTAFDNGGRVDAVLIGGVRFDPISAAEKMRPWFPNWDTLTQAAARGLLAGAHAREQAAAKRWAVSDSTHDKAFWDMALQLEEDLRVFAICGEKP